MRGASVTSQQVHVGDGDSQQEGSQEEDDHRDAKTQLLDAALDHVVGFPSLAVSKCLSHTFGQDQP